MFACPPLSRCAMFDIAAIADPPHYTAPYAFFAA